MSTHNFGNISIVGDGNVSVGGSNITQTREAGSQQSPAFMDSAPPNAAELEADCSRNVFVVHGRDSEVRESVFGLLRRLDLRPLEWEALVHSTREGSPFLGRVIADAPSLAQAAVVLLSPDDVVMLPAVHLDEGLPPQAAVSLSAAGHGALDA